MRTQISTSDLRSQLVQKVRELSGENEFACYQCGKCSAGCPSIDKMDMLPSQVIRLIQMGKIDEALRSNAVWLCASCHTCVVRCPKGVDLAKIMEALRQISLRKNMDRIVPRDIPKSEIRDLPQIALVSAFRKGTA
jgi:heterodisulfide reductase subunit C